MSAAVASPANTGRAARDAGEASRDAGEASRDAGKASGDAGKASENVAPVRFDPAPSVLTVDFEEWFCVCGDDWYSDSRNWDRFEPAIERSSEALLSRLDEAGARATFFVLGWLARRRPELVRRIAAAGHEIAFHGMAHRRCDELSGAELRRDLAEGKALLEDLSGAEVVGFRAPEWSVRGPDDPTLAALAGAGYRYDASMTAIPILGRPGNPRRAVAVRTTEGTILEFPPLTGRGWGHTINFGGGWAFRQLRWSRIVREARRFREQGSPAVFTFHPWEFDPDAPPLTGASPLLRLTRDAHRGRLPRRFRRLLASEPFARFRELL
ncbi:MAG TPA: polysaccharide deacetylase family protein [Thermoanaerobaculia bacterium]|nr:polysaccharide deacetylase family protein [Thermoanaerobaculia bacterium]